MYVQTISKKSRPATKPLDATGSKRIGCATHGLPMSIGIYKIHINMYLQYTFKKTICIQTSRSSFGQNIIRHLAKEQTSSAANFSAVHWVETNFVLNLVVPDPAGGLFFLLFLTPTPQPKSVLMCFWFGLPSLLL